MLDCERLRLVPMTPAFIRALLDGRREQAAALLGAEVPESWPDETDGRHLRLWLDDMTTVRRFAQWRARAIIPKGRTDWMIGHAGFHGPPDRKGMVEIGYTIFEPWRGRGYATEAAWCLMTFAATQGASTLRASVSPDNAASLAVVRKLGLEHVGEQMDEIDGLELVFERPL
ncbi:MAG: GNAT family N-acetyltransferase [Actinomycetota bacterium]